MLIFLSSPKHWKYLKDEASAEANFIPKACRLLCKNLI